MTGNMKTKRALIIDLDNTIWDWVHIWYSYFSTLLRGIQQHVNVDEDDLLSQIRLIHQKHGTSEYAFLLNEIPALVQAYGSSEAINEALRDVIHSFRRARKRSMALYPGVGDLLHNLKPKSVKIAAYTESLEYYTFHRIKTLGLDGVIDRVYSPEDHKIPDNIDIAELRYYEQSYYQLKITEHRYTPPGRLKPDAGILLNIVDDLGVSPEQCVYIGDSLMKDIPMAQDAGVLDALAEYGAAQNRSEYELLRRVSHWTEADVEREKVVLARPSAKPSIVLRKSILEILEYVSFDDAH